MKELETIKRVLKSLTSEEQIALHNATLDMDSMIYSNRNRKVKTCKGDLWQS